MRSFFGSSTGLRLSLAPWAPALLAACALSCDDPAISEYQPRSGVITGTVFYPNGGARGDVYVLLYREDSPPPPRGSARPENLIIIPEPEMFRDVEPGRVGDFAAPYTIPSVPAGRYQVRAFLDADGDFSPLVDLRAQVTAGDVGGGYVDMDTRELLTVEVENDRVSAQVNVLLGSVVPVERPGFAITSTTTFVVPLTRPGSLRIESHAVRGPLVDMDPDRTAFLIQAIDEDRNGQPDDANGDALPDVYPRVLLRRLGDSSANGSIVVPLILDPTPYLDALSSTGRALARRLDLIVPTIAVARRPDGDVILPEIPAGDYEVVVISGTGQTWQVPNRVNAIQPSAPDPTQDVVIVMRQGQALTLGGVTGTLRVARERRGPAYVTAYRVEDPPPPAGTGRPVGFTRIPGERFQDTGDELVAPFEIRGLPTGSYILRGLLDLDGNFSPLSPLRAEASEEDFGGRVDEPISVREGETTSGGDLALDRQVGFPRPRFQLQTTRLRRTQLPASIELTMPEDGVPLLTTEPVEVPVMFTAGDEDGDNLRDLFPRVVLTRLRDDVRDPRLAPNDPETIVIPTVVDPIPFIPRATAGAGVVPARRLRVLLSPVAYRVDSKGDRTPIAPPPAGRYRVNLLSATGQTWSVPSDLDFVLGRVGTPLEDPLGASVVQLLDEVVPEGRIEGTVSLGRALPAGDFRVIVSAFSVDAPPPALGGGPAAATAVLPRSAFTGRSMAGYVLGGLGNGRYTVRAFVDADDDFVPWFQVLNQPDAGDLAGGALDAEGRWVEVEVDTRRSTAAQAPVTFPGTFRDDRPAFSIEPTEPAMVLSWARTVTATLSALTERGEVIRQTGVFPVQWVDLDGDGRADDVDRDGEPDVFPRVLVEQLDPSDPTDQTLAEPRVRVPAVVDPRQFAHLGFPANDPANVETIVDARRLIVKLSPRALDERGREALAPAGRYRITLVNAAGQSWQVPNELARAEGAQVAASQGASLTVLE